VLIAISALQMLLFAVQMIFFGVQYKFFGVQEKNFEHAVQTFAASLPSFGVSFCHLMAQVLLPYGVSFVTLWRLFCCLMLNAVQKSVAFF